MKYHDEYENDDDRKTGRRPQKDKIDKYKQSIYEYEDDDDLEGEDLVVRPFNEEEGQ